MTENGEGIWLCEAEWIGMMTDGEADRPRKSSRATVLCHPQRLHSTRILPLFARPGAFVASGINVLFKG